MEVSVLEIEDPGCFWVAMKGCGPYAVTELEFKNLKDEMNQYYNKYSQGVDEIKPLTVEEGQICVVFSEELKCWCRAVIKSIMYCTGDYLAKCFLLDYAQYVFVTSKVIRVSLEAFMWIPYRAKKCSLYCTKPVTLQVNLCEDTAKMVPAKRWDSAATHYFQNLVKASTQVKAKLCAIEDNTYYVFLYIMTKDEKVCLNDDLVAKNFAVFEEAKEKTRSSADYQNHTSLNEFSVVETVNPHALAGRPMLFWNKTSRSLETGLSVSSSFLAYSYQKLSAALNESTASVVKAIPGLPFKEKTPVHPDRVQHFSNSDPLKTHTIENDHQNSQNQSEERNLVFLSNKIEPLSNLETAPLSDNLKKELIRKKFSGPNLQESYCWPPVAQGCDVVVISNEGNDPFLYIPPVLTFLQLESCYKALPKRNGPLALILCPGWKKAQLVFELLKTYGRCSRQPYPMVVILGQKKEAARSVKIQGCEVIVTTPYSLLRLFEHHNSLFCRLCHLVLDETEVLFSDAPDQVFTILNYYKKAMITGKWKYSPHHIIAVGTQWNKHMAHMIKEFMNDPYIVITAMEEASIYGNVQQVVRFCANGERAAVLLQVLDFTHNNNQKVLVFTNSVNEADMVHKALNNSSVFSLKIHKESKSNFKYILGQWTRKYTSGTPVVLVLTDDCMQALGITDATCVVHFSFPSPRIFGQRLHSMSDNFCEDSSVDKKYSKARSVLLLTEDCMCHALEILCYLQRAEAEIPPELLDVTARMLDAEEEKKFSRPLCAYLKTFGICKNRAACPDRHQINLQIDVPQKIPDKIIKAPGCVTILPLHIINATNYFGRIVDKQKDQYTILAEEINKYFKKASNQISVKNVEKLALYGLHEKTLFHRVQVIEISPKAEENPFFNVKIQYIDEGRTSQVQNYQLLHLPAKFQCLPHQAVEFVVCRVKPIDNEVEWNPEVTHYINDKIKGKLHEAKIVHTLGNTAWVDPMVRVTRIADLEVTCNEYNVRLEILSTGLGADNPDHLTQLQRLWGHVTVSDQAKNLEPLSMKEDRTGPENASSAQNISIQAKSMENCNSSKITSNNHPCDGVAQTKEAEGTTLQQCKSFYPEIQWFQNEVTVTVRVKLPSVADCKCEFSKEKVVFRASSEDKLCLADMELHEYIVAEKCTCVIKDKEATIVLVKEKKGTWCKLLKNKNLHMSSDFDLDHWENFEDENTLPAGAEGLYCTDAVTEELIDSDSETECDD